MPVNTHTIVNPFTTELLGHQPSPQTKMNECCCHLSQIKTNRTYQTSHEYTPSFSFSVLIFFRATICPVLTSLAIYTCLPIKTKIQLTKWTVLSVSLKIHRQKIQTDENREENLQCYHQRHSDSSIRCRCHVGLGKFFELCTFLV